MKQNLMNSIFRMLPMNPDLQVEHQGMRNAILLLFRHAWTCAFIRHYRGGRINLVEFAMALLRLEEAIRDIADFLDVTDPPALI